MDDRSRQGSSCCIVIPARYESSRYPGKPLVRLKGRGGVERSLIEWSWRSASQAPGVDEVIVATDDQRIADEVLAFGGAVAMTPLECANGTERCAAALSAFREIPDVVVNFQGDAPLTPAPIVSSVIERMHSQQGLAVATPAVRCLPETYRQLVDDRASGRVGGTTVVFNREGKALYFSKNIIPHVGPDVDFAQNPVHLHLGLYAYRPDALRSYVASPPSLLELAEGLEQLRFLDMGVAVGAVICDPPEGLMIELNNPTDAPLVEAELARRDL
jgi:3-deoxy-manno-octulosonate cytidylyltransferase (CMP-KDO synthetase)